MALFPERIVFKNSATGLLGVLAEAAPGEVDSLVPGELLLFRETDGFRLYSLSVSGSVVQVGARIKNENKGSLTVTNFGEGSSSFVLNDGSVTTANIPSASITSIKFASPLSIEKGGTGQATATAAINALLPSQAGNTDKVLATDGFSLSWDSKKTILNEYDNVDTVSDPPVGGDCLKWNSATSNWVPDQDIPASIVPASATDTGRPGQLAFDSNYLYSCVGVNRWKRAPLSTWNYAQILLTSSFNSSASLVLPTKIGPLGPQFVGVGAFVSSRTPSIPWPAGHQAGDIGLLVTDSNGWGNATPSGWTLITSAIKPSTVFIFEGLRIWYSYATSSSMPNVAFTTGNYDFDCQIIAFRNVASTNPVDIFASSFTATVPTASQPLSVTTTTDNCAVLYFLRQGGTCGTAGGCQAAGPGTLEPGLFYDYEAFNGGLMGGLVQCHAGRKLLPGVASTDLTYASSTYANNTDHYRITVALKSAGGWTKTLSPPAKDIAVAAPPMAVGYVDPYWSDVALFMSMDGANGSTTFTDQSLNNYPFPSYNGAQISTAQSKFGGSSGFFDGIDDYLASPSNSGGTAATPLSNWWTSSYTIECWVRLISYPGNGITSPLFGMRIAQTGNIYWTFGPVTNGTLRFSYTNTGQGFMGSGVSSSTGVISLNTWHHIAMTHDITTGVIRIFSDGVLRGSQTGYGGTPLTSGVAWIGRMGTTGAIMNGYIDDLRITRNIARYTSNFTPPIFPFPAR